MRFLFSVQQVSENILVFLRKCYFMKINLWTMYTMIWTKNFKQRKLVKSSYLPNSSCMALVSAFVSCSENLFSVGGKRWSSMWSLNWFLDKALILRCGKILCEWLTYGKNLNQNWAKRWFNRESLTYFRCKYLKYT